MRDQSGGVYIHIPFCRKKCLYCDFFSGGVSAADWKGLRRALLNELNDRIEEIPSEVVSVYVGGGTPSVMPVPELKILIQSVLDIIGDRMKSNPEITIEINPEDVTEEAAHLWKDTGFNRVSLGIQSFNDRILASVGRSHSGDEALRALQILKTCFSNISADLIFGLPGQTEEILSEDLKTLLSERPDHISVYSLMYEPGTALTVLRDKGRITPVREETSLAMFSDISRQTKETGYVRYEISNYALPGYEAVHNTLYWTGSPYLGIGPSAHSYDGFRTRRANPPDLKGYISRFSYPYIKRNTDLERKPAFYAEEVLDNNELREEFLLTRLRLKQGFSLSEFRQLFGDEKYAEISERINILSERGMLVEKGGKVSLSEEGIMVGDSIILDLAG